MNDVSRMQSLLLSITQVLLVFFLMTFVFFPGDFSQLLVFIAHRWYLFLFIVLITLPGFYLHNFILIRIRVLGYEISNKDFHRYRRLLIKRHLELPPKSQIEEIPYWKNDIQLIPYYFEIKDNQHKDNLDQEWLKGVLEQEYREKPCEK